MTDISHEHANNPQGQESCRSCLYTGVGTCMVLSGYFLYLAIEEDGHRTPQQPRTRDVQYYRGKSPRNIPNIVGGDTKSAEAHGSKSYLKNIKTSIITFMQGQPVARRNRPFLLALSAFCAGSGAYRLYLN